MADVKISGLPASTTPLAGTEVLPIVQGGATKQVSIANVTAGRSTSALNFIPSGSTVPTNGVYLPAANSVGIATNSINAVYINSSQQVGINNPAPGVPLDVKSIAIAPGVSATSARFGTGSNTWDFRIINSIDGGGIGNVNLAAPAGFCAFTVGASERMRIHATGGVSIGDTTDPGANALRVTNNITSVAGNFVVGTSGKGIDFSATAGTGTSELLNDYEEGTWSAELRGSTTRATTPIIVTGIYTKIGNLVTVSVSFSNKDTTGASGNLQITGLPFTASATGNQCGSAIPFGLNIPNKTFSPTVYPSEATINFLSAADNTGWGAPSITSGAGASKYLFCSLTYSI
jgi:hypothetical protein